MKTFFAVATVALLMGCDAGQPSTIAGESTSGSQSEMSLADRDQLWAIKMQDRVRTKLRDPDSAKFEDVKTFHGGGAPVACGRVNSNNAFGGKSGFQRFVAAGEIIALEEEMAEGEMEKTWAAVCKP